MFAAFPLLALPVLFYNLLAAATMRGGLKSAAPQENMARELLQVPMPNGAAWAISTGDLIVFASLVILFVELLKSTTSRRIVIINHSLSMLLFVICLVEFLLLPAFATSAFFLLTAMVLLDVLAGFIVTIVSARRDVDFGV